MKRILIADDNQQNAELIEAHLDGAGFDTKIVENGEETLQQVNDWKPDVLLLDIMMPKISGFEVCKRIKAEPAKAPSVLMITALDQQSDIDRGVEAGTDDFITKPINKAELLLRVRSMIAARTETNPLDRTLSYLRHVQQGVS
jgi:two-component system, OmpR family, alkaline phosphatase synthesis response regulator PhoP